MLHVEGCLLHKSDNAINNLYAYVTILIAVWEMFVFKPVFFCGSCGLITNDE